MAAKGAAEAEQKKISYKGWEKVSVDKFECIQFGRSIWHISLCIYDLLWSNSRYLSGIYVIILKRIVEKINTDFFLSYCRPTSYNYETS